MAKISILHNPRCSKSRATLQLLKEHGIQPEIIEYLKNPPTPEQLYSILQRLNHPPRECIRSKEPAYQTHQLNNPALSDAALIQLMCEHPSVIERPIVYNDKKAVIGRPPENILHLLEYSK